MKPTISLLKYCIPIVFACLTMQSCYKSPKPRPIDAHIKSNFNYKPGTYWIFQDSLSGSIDTFIVTDNKASTVSSGQDYDVDIINMTAHLKKNGIVTDSILWRLLLRENNFQLTYYDLRVKTSNSNGTYLIYSYPFQQKTNFVQDNLDKVTDYLIPSYTVLNYTYTNVAFSNHTIDTPLNTFDDYYSSSFYTNEETGFVKVSVAFPKDSVYRIWQLVDYNIVK